MFGISNCRINRNILECKFLLRDIEFIRRLSINRNILECKCKMPFNVFGFGCTY